MTEDSNQAVEALLGFMKAMKEWETKFATLYKRENGGPEAHADQAKVELQPIYQKYVTEKDRKSGIMSNPSAGYPTEFDPDAEKIIGSELSSTKKVVLETQWTHPNVPVMTEKNRYTLVKKEDQWRLNKKERFDNIKNKWVTRAL
jgi:hypothetical protein